MTPTNENQSSKTAARATRLRRSKLRDLIPLRDINLISDTGPRVITRTDISSELLGTKAFGLCCLPNAWVPPFFVVSGNCLAAGNHDETLSLWILSTIRSLGFASTDEVIVRSSGTRESMRHRGRLSSAVAKQDDVIATIRKLMKELNQSDTDDVRWIVQKHKSPLHKGHLSNERRFSKEGRDWALEFEPQKNRRGFTTSIGVRPWRDGAPPLDSPLGCVSETGIVTALKAVAQWATELTSRSHFEWVWSGDIVYVVQIDLAEIEPGVRPKALLPKDIAVIKVSSLKRFREAQKTDFERYGKLRNAKLYAQLGYGMPDFYIMDDQAVVGTTLSGQTDLLLVADLEELTKRALVIRTDGIRIPTEKREMLPRSEELRSSKQAEDWLLTQFTPEIVRADLQDADICLIAHHFIPSVASAWARAEPNNRMVRIESLWGIPEGLYWFSHDTFEVDTGDASFLIAESKEKEYRVWPRLRYKGSFIAPNDHGRWIPYQTVPPHDWGQSITRKKWLLEIAKVTRQISEIEKHAVAVMWFVDNHVAATDHKVLPWYHTTSELASSPKAAPRRKRRDLADFHIRTAEDWKLLQESLASGTRVERVVVEPRDADLIRNRDFAETLARLAAARRFVVELSGGILSHAYYVLQREGAQVECIDLFRVEEDVIEFNKLVRDGIPDLIAKRGERVEVVQLRKEALHQALKQKLVEEAFEALDAGSDEELVAELADVKEVVRALCRALGITPAQLEAERREKRIRRGGFKKGLMLRKTAMPPAVAGAESSNAVSLELRMEQPSVSWSDRSDLPGPQIYRRPDLRIVDRLLVEKMLTFQTEVNKLGEVQQTLTIELPSAGGGKQEVALTLELRRSKALIRGVVRLRGNPAQLTLNLLDDSQLVIPFPDEGRKSE